MKAAVRFRNPFHALMAATVLALALFLFASLLVMWGFSALHHDVSRVPALGYVASMWTVILVELLGTLWNLGSGKK